MAFIGRITSGQELTQAQLDNNFLCHYPVGAIYMNANNPNSPNTYIGYGTWKKFAEGRVLLGEGTGFSAGSTGGSLSHTLTTGEIPSHSHPPADANSNKEEQRRGYGALQFKSVAGKGNNIKNSSFAGGDLSHNNVQPYITVYMWERTAT